MNRKQKILASATFLLLALAVWYARAQTGPPVTSRSSAPGVGASCQAGPDGKVYFMATPGTAQGKHYCCPPNSGDPDGTNEVWAECDKGDSDGTVGQGDVVGPGSAGDIAIARYSGTTGKLIQSSPVALQVSGTTYQIRPTEDLDGTSSTDETVWLSTRGGAIEYGVEVRNAGPTNLFFRGISNFGGYQMESTGNLTPQSQSLQSIGNMTFPYAKVTTDSLQVSNASGSGSATLTFSGTGTWPFQFLPDFPGQYAISGDDNAVSVAMIADQDSPADEECATYETGSGKIEWQACGGGGGSPGGSVTHVQFKDTGDVFGGETGFLYDKINDRITLAGASAIRLGASAFGCASDSDVCVQDDTIFKIGSLGYAAGLTSFTLDPTQNPGVLTWNGQGQFDQGLNTNGNFSASGTARIGDNAAGTKTLTLDANNATDSTVVYTTTGDSDRDGTAGQFEFGPAAARSEVFLDDGATMPATKALWWDVAQESTHFGLNSQTVQIGGDCDGDGTTGASPFNDPDDADHVQYLAGWNSTEGSNNRLNTGQYDLSTEPHYLNYLQMEHTYCDPTTNSRAVELNWDLTGRDWDGTVRTSRYLGAYYRPFGGAAAEDYDKDGTADDFPRKSAWAWHTTGRPDEYNLFIQENGNLGIRSNNCSEGDVCIGAAASGVDGDNDGTVDAMGVIVLSGTTGGALLFEGTTFDTHEVYVPIATNRTTGGRIQNAMPWPTSATNTIVVTPNDDTAWVVMAGEGGASPTAYDTGDEICDRVGLDCYYGGGGTAGTLDQVQETCGSVSVDPASATAQCVTTTVAVAALTANETCSCSPQADWGSTTAQGYCRSTAGNLIVQTCNVTAVAQDPAATTVNYCCRAGTSQVAGYNCSTSHGAGGHAGGAHKFFAFCKVL